MTSTSFCQRLPAIDAGCHEHLVTCYHHGVFLYVGRRERASTQLFIQVPERLAAWLHYVNIGPDTRSHCRSFTATRLPRSQQIPGNSLFTYLLILPTCRMD